MDPEVRQRVLRTMSAIVDEVDDLAGWMHDHDQETIAARDPRVAGLRRQQRGRERLSWIVRQAHPPPKD